MKFGTNTELMTEQVLRHDGEKRLSEFYVLCLWAFLPGAFSKRHLLTFLQCAKAATYDIAEMNKQIRAVFARYKPITLAFIEPLYGPS